MTPRTLPRHTIELLRWAALLAAAWLLLRPMLLVSVSLDDYINPFDLFHRYGPSLGGYLTTMLGDVPRTGHFNYLGMAVGGVVYWLWAQLIAAGVRYSLIYAATKFVVIVAAALIAGRVTRRLLHHAGLPVSVWGARAGVSLVLFVTMQLHVPWSLDPAGSFPLSGYLAAAIGLAAIDLNLTALRTSTGPGVGRRAVAVGAVANCAAVLYYELNVVAVAAVVPAALAVAHRAEPARRGRVVRTVAWLTAPVAVMTVVLQQHAAHLNAGYTGTQLAGGSSLVRTVAVAVLGSVPGAAWRVARDWLDQPVGLFATSCAAVAAASAVLLHWMRRPTLWHRPPPTSGARPLLWAGAVALVVWLGSAAVQGATTKVSVEAVRVGYVYNYYAYGSLAVAMLIVIALVWAGTSRWLHRWQVPLVAVAVVFNVVQVSLNDTLQREYDRRLAAGSAVLVAFSEQWSADRRCAAIDSWLELPWWLPYYREAMVDGTNALYLHEHGEPFCATATP